MRDAGPGTPPGAGGIPGADAGCAVPESVQAGAADGHGLSAQDTRRPGRFRKATLSASAASSRRRADGSTGQEPPAGRSDRSAGGSDAHEARTLFGTSPGGGSGAIRRPRA